MRRAMDRARLRPWFGRAPAVSVEHLIEQMPDGFVAVDDAGVILRANPAFAALVQLGGVAAVLGQPIGRWLSRPGADMAVLFDAIRRNGAVRLLPTTIEGELGAQTEVEISATASSDATPVQYGLLLREVGRRTDGAQEAEPLTAMLRAATEQLGRTPLPRVVRDTADAVERYYIRSALDLADGNRTAAAELLGLSRQSLHTKLNRLGFEGAGEEPVADAG